MEENNPQNTLLPNQPISSTPQSTIPPTPPPTSEPSPERSQQFDSQPVTPNIDPAVLMPGFKTGRNSKITAVIAGGIIAVVMVIGLSIFLTALNKQTGQTETKSEETSKEDKKDNSYLTENEKQALVKKILNEVKNAAVDIDKTTSSAETSDVTETTYSIQDVYDSDNPLYFASGAKVPTLADKSFGFVITAPDQPDLINQMAENAKAKLKRLGFSVYKDAGEDKTNSFGWYDSNNKIICTPLRNNYTSLSLSCSHTSWISSEKVALLNSLATAYLKKESELPLFINATTDKIKNSPYEPYQKLIATLPDSVGLFYRSGKDAEWVFFLDTQGVVPCSKYYANAGAKHAFQGDTCLDANGELSKVKENITEEDKTSVEKDVEE